MQNKVSDILKKVPAYLLVGIWIVIALTPLLWMVSTSFKGETSLMSTPPKLIPDPFSLENYQKLLEQPVFLWVKNSVFVATIITIEVVAVSSMAGYAFAKLRFPGKNLMFWILISTMMIPGQVTLAPLYELVMRLGFLDSFKALIFPPMAAVWGTFLLKQFIQTLPTELIDSGRVDGASEWQIFSRIILPIAKPGLAVLGIFTFVAHWNDFMWPLVVLKDQQRFTIQLGLSAFRFEHTTAYGPMMAGATLAALPMVLIFLLLQRYFMEGLTVGALKG